MKKLTIVAILIVTLGICIAGCADKGNAASDDAEVGSTNEEDSVQFDDRIKQVSLIQSEPISIKRDYEVYNAWHAKTTEILSENIGANVKIYSFNMMVSGKIVEVGDFFVTIKDSVAGTCYVDIDSINMICLPGK